MLCSTNQRHAASHRYISTKLERVSLLILRVSVAPQIRAQLGMTTLHLRRSTKHLPSHPAFKPRVRVDVNALSSVSNVTTPLESRAFETETGRKNSPISSLSGGADARAGTFI